MDKLENTWAPTFMVKYILFHDSVTVQMRFMINLELKFRCAMTQNILHNTQE